MTDDSEPIIQPIRAKKPRALDVRDIERLCKMLVDLNLKERKT